MSSRRFSLVGPGRAGESMRRALDARGWECTAVFSRGDDITHAAKDVEVCVLGVLDVSIASVAASIDPGDGVLVHLSGATPIDVLEPHRRAGLHPLVSLADPERGAEALGVTYFAVAGDPIAREMAEALSGRYFEISDADRGLYHSAAAVASNHLVALLGQVERFAEEIGVPVESFMNLVRSSVANVEALGPSAALTGPAARGDSATIDAHRRAISERLPEELVAYDALVAAARRLKDQA